MKTESKMARKTVSGGDMYGLRGGATIKDFHAIHVGEAAAAASVNAHPQIKTPRSINNLTQWILMPLLLSWGVWNCIMVPHVLNVMAVVLFGAMLLLALSSSSLPETASDDAAMQLRIGNLLPHKWFPHLFSTADDARQDVLSDYDHLQSRLRRTTSAASSASTSDSEFEYAVRCSESTIAIDDDFDLYQDDDFLHDDVSPHELDPWAEHEVLWTAPPIVHVIVPPPVVLPMAVPVAVPVKRCLPVVLEASVPTKRKLPDVAAPSKATRGAAAPKRFHALPKPRVSKAALCRSPEIRRMMEELERMQDESDALVVAAESVGLGARCTMNERLRRLDQM
ncbi:Aste57867_24550 [Aphanomyces stellatus]|uniref:Aste57867_24550 protein n=1 Tax=Aphanomyces stellatus TaxID=120398 RepID=A0A485LV12_9STRA|nr:hypothetical protein As57867_024473 [Aphanomyces stellatus]VFU01189.1 Aste57867_24550 [Aphanomyces stellatus]